MTRIKGTNVQFGNSYILPIEKEESAEAIKLKNELSRIEAEIEKAELLKQQIIEDGKKKAEALINEANAKIEAENNEILKKREEEEKSFNQAMEQEAEKIRAEAYQTGYDDGYKQGYVVITNELENKVKAVNDFAKCKFELKNNIIKSSELDMITLVIEIAKKVCTKSIELNPELLKLLTVNAIKELKDKEDITIIVNPKLMEVINSVSDRLKEEIPQLQNIKILEDNSISADGTIVESLLSRVDSRVKSQINEIADKLFEAYNSEDEEFEQFIVSLESPDIEYFEDIELSDDANIEEFLNELEEIPSYDDEIRDEDAQYYRNLDIEALRNEDLDESQSTQNEFNIDSINLDEFEEIIEPDLPDTNDILNDSQEKQIDESQTTDTQENTITKPIFENFDDISDEQLVNNSQQETVANSDILSDLNLESFLADKPMLPELEEQTKFPVKDEEKTGENDVQ